MKLAIAGILLFIAGIILSGALGLLWLQNHFGPMAVVIAVAFLVVMAFVIIIMTGLGLFNLALLNIFSHALANTSDVNLVHAKNVGKLLGHSRGERVQDPPMIDTDWWVRETLPAQEAPPKRLGAVGNLLRRALPGGSDATPLSQAMPLRRPQAADLRPETDQEYEDHLIVG